MEKIIIEVEVTIGNIGVTLTTKHRNMKWDMGLKFHSISQADSFKKLVEKFLRDHPGVRL